MDSNYMDWKGIKTGDTVWVCRADINGYNIITLEPTKGVLSTCLGCSGVCNACSNPIGAEIGDFIFVNESGEIDRSSTLPVKGLLIERTEEACKRVYLNQLEAIKQNLLHMLETLNTLKEAEES